MHKKQLNGRVTGLIIEQSKDIPLEFANVILRNLKDTSFVQGTVTDKNGSFLFDGLSSGSYKVVYSFIGFEKTESIGFGIDAKNSKIDLGKLYISEAKESIDEVQVVGQKSTFVNSIDRKTFNVVTRYDNMFYYHINKEAELSVEYTRPISEKSKLESGYLFEYFDNDLDLYRDILDHTSDVWRKDFGRSNRFIRTESTHVAYITFEHESGKFRFLAGLRGELTSTKANLVTLDSIISKQYPRLYPKLQ